MEDREISDILIHWYEGNKRDLPWRKTSDPYLIWISEIILQQTRVIQGLEYFNRFTERFPNVAALARGWGIIVGLEIFMQQPGRL